MKDMVDLLNEKIEAQQAEIEALKKERDQWEERAEAAWKRLDVEFNVQMKQAIDAAMEAEK